MVVHGLVRADGQLLEVAKSLRQNGLRDGDVVTVVARQARLCASLSAFALLPLGGLAS